MTAPRTRPPRRPRSRRITVMRDGWGCLRAAQETESGRSLPVDPLRGAIKVGRRWYVLASAGKHITFPDEVLDD